jgi:catechol 2,3-dioxygenase-like lactoylglutathione lyase family enzyme
MSAAPDSHFLPGTFRQIGYVVSDLDEAIAGWLSLGVGPWFVMRGLQQNAIYRGKPCSVPFSLAFSNNGDLQVELIQQENDTPSIYTEFLATGREGFHQLAWWAPDFETTLAAAEAAGWPAVWVGTDESTRYAYLEPKGAPATVIELSELNDGMQAMAKHVRDAAANWDGTDPIRSLG